MSDPTKPETLAEIIKRASAAVDTAASECNSTVRRVIARGASLSRAVRSKSDPAMPAVKPPPLPGATPPAEPAGEITGVYKALADAVPGPLKPA